MKTSNILMLAFLTLSILGITFGAIYTGKYVKTEIETRSATFSDTSSMEKIEFLSAEKLSISGLSKPKTETETVIAANKIISRSDMPFVVVKESKSDKTVVLIHNSDHLQANMYGDTVKLVLNKDAQVIVEIPKLSSIDCNNVTCNIDRFSGDKLNVRLDGFAIMNFSHCDYNLLDASALDRSVLNLEGIDVKEGTFVASGKSVINKVPANGEFKVSRTGDATVGYCD